MSAALIALLLIQDAKVTLLGQATGHLGPVTTLRRAGSRMLTAGKDGAIKVWDYPSKKEQAMLVGHEGEVHDVASDGTHLVSAGEDKTLRLWNIAQEKEIRRLEGHPTSVRALALQGKYLVSAGADGAVIVWSVPDFRPAARFETQSTALDAATDGRTAWVACNDGAIHVFDLESKTAAGKLDAGKGAVQCLAVDGKVTAGYLDGHVRVWSEGSIESEWKAHDLAIYSIALDGDTVVTGGQDYSVKVWKGKRLASGFTDRHGVRHVGLISGLIAQGNSIVSASYDGTLRVWDLFKPAPVSVIEAHGGDVSAIFMAADGRLVTGGYDRSVRVWNVGSRKQTLGIDAHTGRVDAVAADGGRIYSAGDDGALAVWDGAGERISEVRGVARALAIKSGQLISAGSDGVIRFWTPPSPKPSAEFKAGGMVEVMQVAQDGRRLVSVGDDRSLRVWDLSKRTLIGKVDGIGMVYSLALSGNLAVAGDGIGNVTIYDLAGPSKAALLGAHPGPVTSASITADGKILATTDRQSRTVKLWDLVARKEIAIENPPKADFVAIGKDKRTLICPDRGTIRFYSIRLP